MGARFQPHQKLTLEHVHIILDPAFSKSSDFAVHNNSSRHFQIYPLWGAFSIAKSYVFGDRKLHFSVDGRRIRKKKLRFQIYLV